jgi:hypothetical protein
MLPSVAANAPLLGGANSKPKARTVSVLVFAVASIAACAVLFLVVGKENMHVSALAQTAVKYYYVRDPLPAHLKINKAKYTLVSAPQVTQLPLSQLDDAPFCSLAGLKVNVRYMTHTASPIIPSCMNTV